MSNIHPISQTTASDRLSALVLTLLILLGVTVTFLAGIWFSMKFFVAKNTPATVELYNEGTGLFDDATYDPDVFTPGIELQADDPTLEESLQIVQDAVAADSAFYADPALPDPNILLSGGVKGDGRTAGSGDGNTGRRHWEFLFPEGSTTEQYAKQLDYFMIEIAVPESGGKVVYASKLSSPKPTVRIGPSEFEKRYYLTWLKGDLQNAEFELLKKAGIEHEGKLVLKFISHELEQQLAQMEAQAAGDAKANLRATYFAIRKKAGSGGKDEYEFFVKEQVK
ncbi:MAG: hypothetical protein ACRC2T_02385 [Thermoguttaceae bacterium]